MDTYEQFIAEVDAVFIADTGVARDHDFNWQECFDSGLTPTQAYEDWGQEYFGTTQAAPVTKTASP